jgi:hypothetical protein
VEYWWDDTDRGKQSVEYWWDDTDRGVRGVGGMILTGECGVLVG